MLWLFPYVVALFLIVLALHRLYHFPVTLDDLIAMARETNDEDMADLMDASREADFRAGMSAAEFRQNQRLRLVRAFEFLRRRLFNGLLMLQYALTMQSKLENTGKWESQAQAVLITEIIEAGVRFRIYAMFAVAKLAIWIVLRFDKWAILPIPSVADFREVVEIDGIHAYYRLTTAVGYLSLFEDEEKYEPLMMKLCGRVPAA
jgi:hypothetical protein